MNAAVEVNGVEKRYGNLVALADLSFEAQPGEILGVLGPNGAGKTTAIRILTTILRATRGAFAVAGVPSSQPTEIRRRIGVLPESAGYPEHQNGEELLRYHARLYGASRTAARVAARALLAEVGLEGRGRSLIATYSRGMRQRLGIARALINEPQVVFLDEPTLGLDPAGQQQMLSIIRRIAADRGACVLLCTHMLAEVEETCSRVLILNRGQVVAQGTVAEVARRAAAPRTATVRVADADRERAAEILYGATGAPGDRGFVVPVDTEPLRRLVEARIAVEAYTVEAARLSDAFLAVTEESR